MASAQPNQSILKGFVILQEVIASARPLGSREISRILAIEHSTANRILGTLVETGMLQQDSESKYLPGPRIHVLSALSFNASGLIPAALPVLETFHGIGATVALGTLWRDIVVYLLHARADQDLAQSAGVHESFPASKSSIGTVLAPGGPEVTYEYRPSFKQRAWAARIGDKENIGIAVVLPEDHPKANPPSVMKQLVKKAALEIYLKLHEEP
ncbi:helix-turn-helix domain-containing protein [Treponema sp. OttesenSCG-928-L16]|nr:helix-turn-helix domain-containing protein [Treponema sp. OttesenSCG-928-L16]